MVGEKAKVRSKDARVCWFYVKYLTYKFPREFPDCDPGNPENCLRNINDFLENKYTFEVLHNQEVNELEIMAGYAILPEEAFSWLKNNDRATFYLWVLIYLDTENHAQFINHDPISPIRKRSWDNNSTKLNTYKVLGLPESPPTHQERLRILRCYFDGAHGLAQQGVKMAHMETLKQQWLDNYRNPRVFTWLNADDEEMCRWFWSRIKEKQTETPGKTLPVTQFFSPSSPRDYYLAALTAWDLWQAPKDTRELFKSRVNHAWHQQKQKEKYRKDDKKAINTYVRKDVKEMLDTLSREYNLRQSDVLEMLITEKYNDR